jgi:curved DNA-binding protein CbpA
MSSVGAAGDRKDARVPRLAPDGDLTRLDLSPQEGFLLSRIDGHTPKDMLAKLAGLPPQAVDLCLARWAEAGVVLWGKSGPPATARRNGAAKETPVAPDACAATNAGAEAGDALAPDPNLEIPEEAQQAILELHARLDGSYPEILGVPVDADARAVKRAYFQMSKEFHPDRYFRRDIGPFKEPLERVFRKVVEAYELMSDPTVRAEMERSLGAAAEPAAPQAESTPDPERAARRRKRALSPFSPIGRLIAKRKSKAKSFFESAMTAVNEERWLEAAGSLRLAIAYDPKSAIYRDRFGEVQARAHEIRFAQLMKEADNALSFRDRKDALRIYEEALHFRPYDPEANHIAAKLAWLADDDLRSAKDYATRAVEADPDNAQYHRGLGQIFSAAGLKANARRGKAGPGPPGGPRDPFLSRNLPSGGFADPARSSWAVPLPTSINAADSVTQQWI